jgi:hypothetical protein
MFRNLLQSGTATQREKGRRGLPDAQRHRDRRESCGRERRGRPQRVSERCSAAGCLSPARCVGVGRRGRRLCALPRISRTAQQRCNANAYAASRNSSLGDIAQLVVFCCWKCAHGTVHKPMAGSRMAKRGPISQ